MSFLGKKYVKIISLSLYILLVNTIQAGQPVVRQLPTRPQVTEQPATRPKIIRNLPQRPTAPAQPMAERPPVVKRVISTKPEKKPEETPEKQPVAKRVIPSEHKLPKKPTAAGAPSGVKRIIPEYKRQERKTSLAKARTKAAKRDETEIKPIEQIIESKKPDRFTQTEALLHLQEVRKLINDNYNVEPYLNIISSVIANEAKFRNTHYAFYHTTPNIYRLTQDLYTQLYAYTHSEKKISEHFKFLRFSEEASVNETAQGWLVKELKEKGLVDDNTEAGAILLSVNLSLFGNVGFSGECSWQYFVHPQGHKEPNRETYEEMMKQFGLTDKYIDEIMSLVDIYKTSEDTLLQVLIPKDKVGQIGYLAWVKGIPAHQDVIDLIKSKAKSKSFEKTNPVIQELTEKFAEEGKKNPLYADMLKSVEAGDFNLADFLKIYCNKPWDLPNINDVTARLLFTPDVLLNPTSGVEFYRFSTARRDQLKEYRRRLNEIVDKLILDKEMREEIPAE